MRPVEHRVPRGQKRREEIAAIAEQIFLELGFAETTMQIVATRAGASKETLYRHFGCKAELFSEVMNARCRRFMTGAAEVCSHENDPATALAAIGSALLDLILSPNGLAMYRIVVTETVRTPELGHIFFNLGPNRLLAQVSDYLKSMTAMGKLNCPEPLLAAKLFLGAVGSSHQMRELAIPGVEVIGEKERKMYVDEAVAMFLARYGRP